jgi:hypothetical protein
MQVMYKPTFFRYIILVLLTNCTVLRNDELSGQFLFCECHSSSTKIEKIDTNAVNAYMV